jgi:cell wall assembly regulator SMI1
VPATEEQLRDVEAEIGYCLHDEVRAAYLRHDGTFHQADRSYDDGANFPIFNSMAVWLPLSFALDEWRTMKRYKASLSITVPEVFPSYQDCWEDLVVRPVSWDEGHFPIGMENTKFRIFVDMVPGGKGTVGQIFGDDGSIEQSVYAPSFNMLIGAIANHLESGALEFDVNKGGIFDPKTGYPPFKVYPKIIS